MSRAETKCSSSPAGIAKRVIEATCEEAPLLLASGPGRPGKVCLEVTQTLSQAGALSQLRVDDRSPLFFRARLRNVTQPAPSGLNGSRNEGPNRAVPEQYTKRYFAVP